MKSATGEALDHLAATCLSFGSRFVGSQTLNVQARNRAIIEEWPRHSSFPGRLADHEQEAMDLVLSAPA